MSELGELAEVVVETELPFLTGSDQSGAISTASGWFCNNVGKLNTLIFTSYSGENPGLQLEEQAIYSQMYMGHYWGKKAANVMQNMDSTTLAWISIQEGDSKIQLQNRNETAKTYREMARSSREELDALVQKYLMFQTDPRSIGTIVYESGVTHDGPHNRSW